VQTAHGSAHARTFLKQHQITRRALASDTILVTGAAGKVGQAYIARALAERKATGSDVTLRALCHNRLIPEQEGLEVIRGSISDRDVVKAAMQGVTHVVHLATCKETPEAVMDVTVKGLFWLLEECRVTEGFKRFILLGGDAGMGHFFYPHPDPVTEAQRHSAYPGCYALSKVLEEVMVEQYRIQYGLDGCCLRAPWIMEKDDFKYTLSFGEDVFGGPRWRDLVGAEAADDFVENGTVPLMLGADGKPMRRNFVHVDDLVEAILIATNHPNAASRTFNICMDEPVDYGKVAAYLHETRGLPCVSVPTEYHSTWLDNSRARFLLGWRPRVGLHELIDRAYDYQRSADDPRIIWYPG
jgi:UDP-glucose 4-epimerase